MSDLIYTIFLMTIAGSIGVAIFKVAVVLTKTHFSSSWHYAILKLIAILFMLPIATIYRLIQIPKLSVSHDVPVIYTTMQAAKTGNNLAFMDFVGKTVRDVTDKVFEQNFVWIWLIGVILFVAWQIISFLKFKKKLQYHKPVLNEQLLLVLDHCKDKLNIRQAVKLVCTDKAAGPMLIGLFSPVIVLPNEKLTETDAEFIFTHELIHLKSKDLWVKIICIAIKAVHWFNPAVHLLCREMDMWREFSCDEKVIEKSSHEQRKQYGMAILSALLAPTPSTTITMPFASTKPNIERRLTIMLNFKKMRMSKKVVSIMAAVAVLACSAIPVLAAVNAIAETPSEVVYSQTKNVASYSSEVIESTNATVFNAGNTDIEQPSLYASGDLSSGKSYSYDKQTLSKDQSVTINADWTPTGSNIQIGLKSSSGTVTAKSVSGGSGSVTYTIKSDGDYSIYVGNPSTANVKFDVSYIVN